MYQKLVPIYTVQSLRFLSPEHFKLIQTLLWDLVKTMFLSGNSIIDFNGKKLDFRSSGLEFTLEYLEKMMNTGDLILEHVHGGRYQFFFWCEYHKMYEGI